jgi:hypothetical protein
MLARLKWFMKQSAINKTRIRQRTEDGDFEALSGEFADGLAGRVIFSRCVFR